MPPNRTPIPNAEASPYDLAPSTKTPNDARAAEVILVDRPCIRCGYNLRGLAIGGRCPECGELITRHAKRLIDDSLVLCPTSFITAFATGAWLMFAGSAIAAITIALVVAGGLFGAFFGGVRGLFGAIAPIHLLGLGGGAWLCGMLILNLPRPKPAALGDKPRPGGEWVALRITAGAMQFAGVLGVVLEQTTGAVAAALGPTPPIPPSMLPPVIGILILIGVVGLIPTMLWLARVADWLPDEDGARAFRGAAWCVIVVIGLQILFGLLSLVIVGSGFLYIAGMLTNFFATVTGFYIVWRLYDLARTATWAIRNHHEAEAQAARLRARVAAEAAAADAERRQKEPFGGPLPPLP